MKVLLVLLPLSVLASLEPAGYRPPGASTTTRYLPPSSSTDGPASPSPYFYLPPQVQLRPQKTPAPAAPPANTYLPPLTPSAPATTEYLPPASRAQPSSAPSTEYLPASSPPPPGGYLPPAQPAGRKPAAGPLFGPSSGPPPGREERPPGVGPPASDYLPPAKPDARGPAQPSFGYGAEAATALGREQLTTEPAKYEFEYRVSDEFGNDYSHKESRDGSQTQGFYSVLLPDGRKQIVHYEADEAGFRPKITYEEVATVLGPRTPDVAGYDGSANSLGTQGPY